MKQLFLLSFCITIVAFSQVFGQKNLDVQWGPWGLEAEDHQQYFSLGKSFEDSTGFLIVQKNGELNYFDEGLLHRYDAQLFGSSKDVEVLITRRLSRKALIVTVEKGTSVKLYKYNYRDKVVEFKSELFSVKKSDGIGYTVSSDSSKYLIYSWLEGKNVELSCFVFDSLFKAKWDKQEIALQTDDPYFMSPAVNDDGDVAFADDDKENLVVRILNTKGTKHYPKSYPHLGEKPVNTVSSTKGSVFCYALVYNKDNVNLICTDKIRAVQIGAGGKTIASAKLDLPDCLASRRAVHLFPSKKNWNLILESFSTTQNSSNNQIRYGEINTIGLDIPNSKVIWNNEIFKNQYFVADMKTEASPQSVDYKTSYGHGFFLYKGDAYLLYGDNCLNCINMVRSPKSHSNLKNSCLALVSIGPDGKVMRHTNASMPKVKYKVDIASIVLAEPGKVLLKTNAKQKRLGLVNLNR